MPRNFSALKQFSVAILSGGQRTFAVIDMSNSRIAIDSERQGDGFCLQQ